MADIRDIPEWARDPYLTKKIQMEDARNLAMIQDDPNSASSIYGVQHTPGGSAFLSNSPDSYINALNQDETWAREEMHRREGYAREDNSYHRLFEELRSLGVNPALLLSSVGPTTGSAGSYTTSAFKTSNVASSERTDEANSAKMAGALIAALGLIIAAFA